MKNPFSKRSQDQTETKALMPIRITTTAQEVKNSAPPPRDENGAPLYCLTVRYISENGEELYQPHKGYYLAGQQVMLLAPFGEFAHDYPEYDALRIQMPECNLMATVKYESIADYDVHAKKERLLTFFSYPQQQTLADYIPYM